MVSVRCIFCHADSSSRKISKEYILSVPICRALKIDRDAVVVSLDGNTGDVAHAAPLGDRQVRLPCAACNSGWMGNLEQETAAVLHRWTRHTEALSAPGLAHLTRWMAKTAIVLGFGETGARHGTDDPESGSFPDATRARQLGEGNVPDGVVGGALAGKGSMTLWGAGNATVEPAGPDRISSRAVNVVALNLGALQLWGVFPFVRPDAVVLPSGVLRLSARSTFRRLRSRRGGLDPALVAVRYSDATTEAFQDALTHHGSEVDDGGTK